MGCNSSTSADAPKPAENGEDNAPTNNEEQQEAPAEGGEAQEETAGGDGEGE